MISSRFCLLSLLLVVATITVSAQPVSNPVAIDPVDPTSNDPVTLVVQQFDSCPPPPAVSRSGIDGGWYLETTELAQRTAWLHGPALAYTSWLAGEPVNAFSVRKQVKEHGAAREYLTDPDWQRAVEHGAASRPLVARELAVLLVRRGAPPAQPPHHAGLTRRAGEVRRTSLGRYAVESASGAERIEFYVQESGDYRAAFPDRTLALAAPGWLAPLVELVGGVDRLIPVAGLDPVPGPVPTGWPDHAPEWGVNLHGRGPGSQQDRLPRVSACPLKALQLSASTRSTIATHLSLLKGLTK